MPLFLFNSGSVFAVPRSFAKVKADYWALSASAL